jgi:hypothetical protein
MLHMGQLTHDSSTRESLLTQTRQNLKAKTAIYFIFLERSNEDACNVSLKLTSERFCRKKEELDLSIGSCKQRIRKNCRKNC